MSRRYSPWADLARRHPEVHVECCPCDPIRGAWVPEVAVVLISQRLTPAERRVTLAHELAHIDLDHAPTGNGRYDARQERAADELAAHRLLALDELGEALTEYGADLGRVASTLDVTERAVRIRLDGLDPAERRYLRRRVSRREQAA